MSNGCWIAEARLSLRNFWDCVNHALTQSYNWIVKETMKCIIFSNIPRVPFKPTCFSFFRKSHLCNWLMARFCRNWHNGYNTQKRNNEFKAPTKSCKKYLSDIAIHVQFKGLLVFKSNCITKKSCDIGLGHSRSLSYRRFPASSPSCCGSASSTSKSWRLGTPMQHTGVAGKNKEAFVVISVRFVTMLYYWPSCSFLLLINKMKYMKTLHHVSCEERLHQLKFFSLERRRLRADLILAFNILKGEVDLNPSDFFFRPPRAGLRGHTYRLLQGPSRLRRKSGAFSVRVVKYWNKLPAHLVLSSSVSIFKKSIGPSMTRNLPWSTCVTSVPIHCPFSQYCHPRLFMFSLTPIPDRLMWLLLVLVVIPTINQ